MCFFEVSAAALGTVLGQAGVKRFVDEVFWRRWPMGMLAMLLAGLSTWLFGFGFGRLLGERSGLSFGDPFDSFNASHELGDAFFEFGDTTIAFGKLPSRFAAARTRRSDGAIHAGQLSETMPPQLQELLPRCRTSRGER